MVTFLTSSPTKELTREFPRPALYECNGFIHRLKEEWQGEGRCIMIAAFPGDHPRNDEMTDYYRQAVENAGLTVACFELWDDRREPLSRGELQSYDAVFLAGGHVPTERRWFESISLREKLEGYSGLLIGTSAGSMNAAEVVYAWPEEPGESMDPNHQLFFPGLGGARTMVLPHYQKMKDNWLDGRRLMEDITCSHSYGQRFLAIPDGSYVLAKEGQETVYGEAWLVAEGAITLFCRQEESRMIE